MGDSGETKARLKEAEKEFEDARLKLLKLSTSMCASSTAPVLHQAESNLAEATELNRVTKLLENDIRSQVESVDKQIEEQQAIIRKKQAEVEMYLKQIRDLKEGKKKRQAEIESIAAQIVEL